MSVNGKPKRARKIRQDEPVYFGKYLVVDPRVCHGQLTFRGTRVPVETILSYLGRGYSLDYLQESWPQVSPEAIAEAVKLASEQLIEHCGGTKR